MRKVVLCFILVALSLTLVSVGTAAAGTIYVNKNASGINSDGKSWSTAFTKVQAGINAAASGDEVWVAKGTYFECITLKDGVALYGGFIGNETERTQRNFRENVTILDGNQAGSVVTSSYATSATKIDGFTIRNGIGTAIITECTDDPGPYYYGGGIYCYVSSPTISNNIITGNSAYRGSGGGIYCIGQYPTISNNIIMGNSADSGGGIGCVSSSPGISNNIISGNSAISGGGIYCFNQASASILNNSISDNIAEFGGGIYYGYSSSPVISNNNIVFGSSGIYGSGGSPKLRNNNVFGNTDYNYSGVQPGTGSISEDPNFVDRTNGDYHLQASSPCIDAGDDGFVQPGWVDIDGEARIQGAHVDIGADEFTVDAEAPVTSISLSGILGQNGWYISDVQITLTATDGMSGVAKTEYRLNGADWVTYTEPFTISTEGTITISYRSTDNAGNIETAKEEIVKIDKTKPIIAIDTPGSGAEYLLNQMVLANWSVDDYISGIFSKIATALNGETVNTASIGAKTFSVTAQDCAGHEKTETVTYYVRYDYSGVLQPINADGSSIFRMGKNRTVPVKFQLKDANGDYIGTAIARIYLTKISDEITGTELEGISTSAATEDNLFRYDEENNQYIYNLATSNLSVGTWQIRIELDDGTNKYVNISLK